MTTVHVLRVFVNERSGAGNALGVVLAGDEVPPDRRQSVAAELGYSETVFVDAIEDGTATIQIFTPAVEMVFAGHPAIGTSWLLRELGQPVGVLRVPAGDVRTWREGPLTWIRARQEWQADTRYVEYATVGEVDALRPLQTGDRNVYAWAWEDAGTGLLRARYFAPEIGIEEDEATGAAAVGMGARHEWPLRIRQGVGSEIHVRRGPDGLVEVGGRVVRAGEREV